MFDIDVNGKITITKGDTGKFELFIDQGTAENPMQYNLVEGDEVHLYVYQAGCCSYEKDAFIHDKFTLADVNEEGLVEVKIKTSDTSNVKPGEYRYRVKLIKALPAGANPEDEPDVDTIIDENTFVIKS